MVGADLEGLLLAHEQADLAGVIALQQPHLPNATLLPLPRVVVEAVQLALAAGTRMLVRTGSYRELFQVSLEKRLSGKITRM